MSLLTAQAGAQPPAASAAPSLPAPQTVSQPPPGELLYRNGLLLSGAPLTAQREGGAPLSGAEAACINCHRRSGLGETEGGIKIPPLSGPYLFRPRAARRDELAVPYLDNMRLEREPYTAATLARAIREGVGAGGEALNYLMPRYTLGDADMAALMAYLQGIRPLQARGVAGAVVNFATIVTPDADPSARRGMQSVLEQYFADQNGFALAQRPRQIASESMKSNALRRWELHVWELRGAPSTWTAQLERLLEQQPVYAAISGLGGKDWRPIHEFCERASLPCILPNLELPVVAEQDFYPMYFSKGVLLEAELLARQLATDTGANRASRIVQIFRADDIGAAAAQSLKSSLTRSGIGSIELTLPAGEGALPDLMRGVRSADRLVLWLRPADLASLASVAMRASGVFASGLMGGLENAPLPGPWRPKTRLTYPAELPQRRLIGTEFALGWMRHHRIPVLDAQVQVNTYTACGLLMAALTNMQGSFNSDYLIERLEGLLEHQLVSGYYPSLALAPNERFASKGAYFVHLANPAGSQLASDSGWLVP